MLNYWLGLTLARQLGLQGKHKLLQYAGGIESLYAMSLQDFAELGISTVTYNNLHKPPRDIIRHALTWAEKESHHIITLDDELYPALLREISDPPLCLYVVGDPRILGTHCFAMVGSRNATTIGKENAYNFAQELANSGLTIVSGLAIGIDGASHRGAVDAKRETIAVLGTGLLHVYPRRHVGLARDIISQGGALVSEFPLNTPAQAQNFPQRNRIISGLSLGTLVVEAALKSGSLITSRYAMEQNRDVFTIPSSIRNPAAKGCHALIKNGAKLVEGINDILEEYDNYHIVSVKTACAAPSKKLDPKHQKLVELVDFSATPVDLLVKRSGLPVRTITSMLITLELEGYVVPCPGGYARAR